MFERGGPNGWGCGGSPPGEKNQIFLFLVPKMAYFNWNYSKILSTFLFSLLTRGGYPPFAAEWGSPDTPPPLAETLLSPHSTSTPLPSFFDTPSGLPLIFLISHSISQPIIMIIFHCLHQILISHPLYSPVILSLTAFICWHSNYSFHSFSSLFFWIVFSWHHNHFFSHSSVHFILQIPSHFKTVLCSHSIGHQDLPLPLLFPTDFSNWFLQVHSHYFYCVSFHLPLLFPLFRFPPVFSGYLPTRPIVAFTLKIAF